MDQMYRSSGQTHERSIIDHSMDAHGAPIDLQTWMGLKASDDGYLRHGEGGQAIRACLGASCSKARLPIHEHTHTHTGVTAGYSSCCPVSSDGQCCVGLQITHIQPSSGGDELGSVYIS